MKPAFALSLSFEGISLLHRCAGGWRNAGDVALDTPDLAAAMAGLRDAASRLAAGPLYTKLIISNDQIRYLSVDTGTVEGTERDALVRAALEGATPYALSELAYDVVIEGTRTHIAAVARDTLAEAEQFAIEHRFGPLCLVAIPGSEAFPGEPCFGASEFARTNLAPSEQVEADGIAVVVIGPAEFPVAAAPLPEPMATVSMLGPTPTAAPIMGPAPAAVSGPEQEPAVAPFSDLHRRTAPLPQSAGAAQLRATPTRFGPSEPSSEPAAPQVALQQQGQIDLSGTQLATAVPEISEPVPDASVQMPSGAAALPDETMPTAIHGRRQSSTARPRLPSLILTAALLLVLAGVAAWAFFVLDDDFVRLFDREPANRTVRITPEPDAESGTATPDSQQTAIQPGENRPPAPQVASTDFDLPAMMSPGPVIARALLQLIEPEQPVTRASRGPSSATPGKIDPAVLDDLKSLRLPAISLQDSETPHDIEKRYAVTGIWSAAPPEPETPSVIGLGDLFIGLIDNRDLSQDAIALAAPETFMPEPYMTDGAIAPKAASAPKATSAPPETTFDFDGQGLVRATPEGALSPDGHVVYLDRPAVTLPATPDRTGAEPEADQTRLRLAGFRPRARPDDPGEPADANREQPAGPNQGELAHDELAQIRTRKRPASVEQQAEASEQSRQTDQTTRANERSADENAEEDGFATATAQAVATAQRPRNRPDNFSARVEQQRSNSRNAIVIASIAPRTITPQTPGNASVSRLATLKNAINLRRVNLIGVYGTPSNRRALVRLPGGRYSKVQVGDEIDGGQISAIGDSELRYQKGGRNLVLKIPSG